jgi:FkbM family methyltransferase
MRRAISSIFKRLGYQITRWEPYPFASHLASLGITLVFDVGANVGQFGKLLRISGYSGRIVSFEPVNSAYAQLSSAAANDQNWIAIPFALGSTEEQATININRNSDMSSIRTLREDHAKAHGFESNGTQTIRIVRLDDVFDKYAISGDRVLLKLDVQGYEDEVLKGAIASFDRIVAVQTEMSIVPTYSEQKDIGATINDLNRAGFDLIDIANGFRESNKRLLEVDGFFTRRPAETEAAQQRREPEQ